MVRAVDRTPLQVVSKLAFNREHRLEVARALLERREDMVDRDVLVAATGVSSSGVFAELTALCELGVLRLIPDGTRNLYTLEPGPFWEWCAALMGQAATRASEPSEGIRPPAIDP